jgi:hypothetical protein
VVVVVEPAGAVVVAGGVVGAIVSVVAGAGVVVVVVVEALSSEPEQAVRAKRADAQSAREIFFMTIVHLFELIGPQRSGPVSVQFDLTQEHIR